MRNPFLPPRKNKRKRNDVNDFENPYPKRRAEGIRRKQTTPAPDQLSHDDRVKITPFHSNKCEIPPLPLSHIFGRFPGRNAIVGHSGTGKTNLVGNMINKMIGPYFDAIYFFSPSVNIDDVPSQFIHKNIKLVGPDWDPQRLKDIIAQQERDYEILGPCNARRVWVILDDYADNPSVMRSALVRRLFFHGS